MNPNYVGICMCIRSHTNMKSTRLNIFLFLFRLWSNFNINFVEHYVSTYDLVSLAYFYVWQNRFWLRSYNAVHPRSKNYNLALA